MLPQLNQDECRVIGVMIEKAQTTPGQYPMTINALTIGCNQKNNRQPIMNFDEERLLDAVDGLRAKNMIIMVNMASSRVLKYKHDLRQALGVNTSELVVLAELLLRGPQTVGELRTRASRMHPLESLEVVQNVLQHLMGREEPMIHRVPSLPGSRAKRYAQLLCPDVHPTDQQPSNVPTVIPIPEIPDLARRVDQLESEVARLNQAMTRIAHSLGEPQLLDPPASEIA